MSAPAVTSPNRPLVIGGALLLAGFAAGFFAGQESMRQVGAAPLPLAAAPDPHAGHSHGPDDGAQPEAEGRRWGSEGEAPGNNIGPASIPGRSGHTFTGELNVPPHGEKGHGLAQVLLANATCPCGGCEGMRLLECGCDTSREVEGLAAHLLERGKPESEVLAQLTQHFGLVAAGGAGGPKKESGFDGLADAFKMKPGIQGPANVPSSARRTGPQ